LAWRGEHPLITTSRLNPIFFIALAAEPMFSGNLGLTKMIEMESKFTSRFVTPIFSPASLREAGSLFPFMKLIIAMKNYLDYHFFLS
jgi:hypothetical protein